MNAPKRTLPTTHQTIHKYAIILLKPRIHFPLSEITGDSIIDEYTRCPHLSSRTTATSSVVVSNAISSQGKVSISTPVSVMRTVCSNCAALPPSRVTTVQSSDHSSQSGLPSVIIGSIVKIIPGRSSIFSSLRKCYTRMYISYIIAIGGNPREKESVGERKSDSEWQQEMKGSMQEEPKGYIS